jgi:hypothetical protein
MSPLLVTLALIAVEFVYLRGWYRLSNAIPHLLSVWRLAAFSCGLLALWRLSHLPSRPWIITCSQPIWRNILF